ncbi:MAG: DUF2752 domain-containing protein [Thermomicrobiales bacterium]
MARGPRLCLISAIIRRPCPACGMTRAAAALLRGDVRRAIKTNPRIILVAAIGLSMLVSDARSIIIEPPRRQGRQEMLGRKKECQSLVTLGPLGVVAVLNPT